MFTLWCNHHCYPVPSRFHPWERHAVPVKPSAPLPAPRPGGHRAPVCRNALAPQGSQHFVACHSARRFAGSCVCGRVGAWSRSPSASRSPARVSRGLERSLAVASASWLPGTLCTSVAWPRFRFSCADPETGVPFAVWGPSAHGGRCRQRSAGCQSDTPSRASSPSVVWF